MTAEPRALEAQIVKIKATLAALGDLRPGTLSQQYNVCGKPGCRCKARPPRKHGPYYQVSFTWRGKSHSQFVRHADLPALRQQVRTYQRLRTLVDRWIRIALELSRLRLREARSHPAKTRPRVRVSGQTRGRRVPAGAP